MSTDLSCLPGPLKQGCGLHQSDGRAVNGGFDNGIARQRRRQQPRPVRRAAAPKVEHQYEEVSVRMRAAAPCVVARQDSQPARPGLGHRDCAGPLQGASSRRILRQKTFLYGRSDPRVRRRERGIDTGQDRCGRPARHSRHGLDAMGQRSVWSQAHWPVGPSRHRQHQHCRRRPHRTGDLPAPGTPSRPLETRPVTVVGWMQTTYHL